MFEKLKVKTIFKELAEYLVDGSVTIFKGNKICHYVGMKKVKEFQLPKFSQELILKLAENYVEHFSESKSSYYFSLRLNAKKQSAVILLDYERKYKSEEVIKLLKENGVEENLANELVKNLFN